MQSDVRHRILSAVEARSDEVVSFLQRIIQIDSETGREGPILHFLASTLEAMGLKIDMCETNKDELVGHPAYIPVEGQSFAGRPNLVGVLEGDPRARSLILNGQIDTINCEPLTDWSEDPHYGLVRDGKIYGRGASDMKGGVAATIMALKILLDAGLRPRGTVIVKCVPDEEVTGCGTLSAILRGYQADAGICPETSDMNVQPACIGRMWFTIEVCGKTLSVSSRWDAVSAIDKAIKLVRSVEDHVQMSIDDLRHPMYPDIKGAVASAVCMFEAGTFPTAVPCKATLRGSLALLPFEDIKEVQADFGAHIERVARADPWMRNRPPTVTFKDVGADGAEIPPDHPIVKTVTAAYVDAIGAAPIINGRRGGADTRYLIKHGGTPTLIFGPGITTQVHAINEWVPVENVIQATKVLALSVYDWCQ